MRSADQLHVDVTSCPRRRSAGGWLRSGPPGELEHSRVEFRVPIVRHCSVRVDLNALPFDPSQLREGRVEGRTERRINGRDEIATEGENGTLLIYVGDLRECPSVLGTE